MLENSTEVEGGSNESPVSLVNQDSNTNSGAVIGASIRIKGEVSGDENLTINGRVEGSVELREHDLLVGKSGEIKANVVASEVCIDGEVTGDITGIEKVVVSSEGRVQGNIVAPRVTLEDGAKFKGSIDMDPSEKVVAEPPQLSLESAEDKSKSEKAKKVLQQVKRQNNLNKTPEKA